MAADDIALSNAHGHAIAAIGAYQANASTAPAYFRDFQSLMVTSKGGPTGARSSTVAGVACCSTPVGSLVVAGPDGPRRGVQTPSSTACFRRMNDWTARNREPAKRACAAVVARAAVVVLWLALGGTMTWNPASLWSWRIRRRPAVGSVATGPGRGADQAPRCGAGRLDEGPQDAVSLERPSRAGRPWSVPSVGTARMVRWCRGSCRLRRSPAPSASESSLQVRGETSGGSCCMARPSTVRSQPCRLPPPAPSMSDGCAGPESPATRRTDGSSTSRPGSEAWSTDS